MYVCVSLSFWYLNPKQKSSNGFFNQIQSLLNAVQIAERWKRTLVVDGFYPDFETNESIPLDRVIDLTSISAPIVSGAPVPTKISRFSKDFRNPSPEKWLNRFLTYENHIPSLFIGCCFYYQLDHDKFLQDLKNLRFHPFFYNHIRSFLQMNPVYKAVHLRLERDFSQHFFKEKGFSSPEDMEQIISNRIHQHIWKHGPTLIVSGEFDPGLNPLSHLKETFRFYPDKNQVLMQLGLSPDWKRTREINALMDFLLCCSPACSQFLGVEQSSFSIGILKIRDNTQDQLICSSK